MDTAKLPTRLHELYPLDCVPLELPQNEEDDFYQLEKVAEHIIQRLKHVWQLKFSTRFLH